MNLKNWGEAGWNAAKKGSDMGLQWLAAHEYGDTYRREKAFRVEVDAAANERKRALEAAKAIEDDAARAEAISNAYKTYDTRVNDALYQARGSNAPGAIDTSVNARTKQMDLNKTYDKYPVGEMLARSRLRQNLKSMGGLDGMSGQPNPYKNRSYKLLDDVRNGDQGAMNMMNSYVGVMSPGMGVSLGQNGMIMYGPTNTALGQSVPMDMNQYLDMSGRWFGLQDAYNDYVG